MNDIETIYCGRLFEVGDYEGNYVECSQIATRIVLGKGKPLAVCDICAEDFKKVGVDNTPMQQKIALE